MVEQDGLADAGELAEQFADGHPQSGAGGAKAHEVGDLEGQDAGEDVDADVVLGPVMHGRERHDAGVFHLAEGELGFGLGPVPGHDPGHGPVVVIGDQDVLAEEFFFQRGPGVRVDAPGQAQVPGLVAGQCQVMTRRTQGLAVIVWISAVTLSLPRRVLPRAKVAASSSSFLPALASVVPSNPRAWPRAVPGSG